MKKEEKRERKKGGDLYLSRADVFFGNLSRKVRESVFLSSVSALFRRFRGAVNRKNGKADDKEPSLLRRARRTATAEFERSVLVTGLRNLGRMILSAKLRTLGILLLSFGVWSVSADLLLTLFLGNGRISFERTWFSVAASLTSLPMLFCGSRSVGRSVLQSRILHFLLFDLLGLSEAPFREAGAREGGGFTAFLMGLFFGAATLFISPLRLAAALGIFLCLLISLFDAGKRLSSAARRAAVYADEIFVCGTAVHFRLLPFKGGEREAELPLRSLFLPFDGVRAARPVRRPLSVLRSRLGGGGMGAVPVGPRRASRHANGAQQ